MKWLFNLFRRAEKHRCPRRLEVPKTFQRNAGEEFPDRWIPERDGEIKGLRVCDYCGSIHPDDFMRYVELGARLDPTDKNYKAYLNIDTGKPEKRKEISRGNGNKTILYSGGVKNVKFYFMHLSVEQKRRLISLTSAKKINFSAPGRWYVAPYFMTPE